MIQKGAEGEVRTGLFTEGSPRGASRKGGSVRASVCGHRKEAWSDANP